MPDLAHKNAYEWYLGSEFWAEKRRCAMERVNYVGRGRG
jgi:hypothetical protein